MSDVRRLPVGEGNEGVRVTLDELAREGARRMIAVALEAEVDEYVSSFTDEVGEDGKRLVVRNERRTCAQTWCSTRVTCNPYSPLTTHCCEDRLSPGCPPWSEWWISPGPGRRRASAIFRLKLVHRAVTRLPG